MAGNLPPLFALSSLLAPLPILYLLLGITDGSEKNWGYGAIVGGAFLCSAIAGLASAFGFLLTSSIPALILSECLGRRVSLERSVTICFVIMVAVIGLFAFEMRDEIEKKAIPELRTTVTSYAQSFLDVNTDKLNDSDKAIFQALVDQPERWLWKIPGWILVSLQMLSIFSLLVLLRWNPKRLLYRLGLAHNYLRRWRTPDYLIWPALVCIATQLLPYKQVAIVGEIIGWPLVFLYFLHGISIFSFYLDLFRVPGVLRVIFYGIALVPAFGTAVVSFGFFDLWFNFRERARPAKTEARSDRDK